MQNRILTENDGVLVSAALSSYDGVGGRPGRRGDARDVVGNGDPLPGDDEEVLVLHANIDCQQDAVGDEVVDET